MPPTPPAAINEAHLLIPQGRFRPLRNPVYMIADAGGIHCFSDRERVFEQLGRQLE
jgi:hypothetical protein